MSGSGSEDPKGTLTLWNAVSGQVLKSWPMKTAYSYDVSFSFDGQTLAATNMSSGTIQLWRVGNI